MQSAVVRLGAWCDLETEDEARQRLLDGAAGGEQPAAADERPGPRPGRYVPVPGLPVLDPGSANFRVEEFADLADGRRVRLHADRGFALGGGGDPWRLLTVELVESSVLTTVLPDDAEETGDDHPWEWLADLLRAHGLAATADELRGVPYVVELSDRLRTRLAAAG